MMISSQKKIQQILRKKNLLRLINDKGMFEKSSENPEKGNCLPQEVGSSTLR